MNLKTILPVVAVLLTASAVHADPPISQLTAVRLHLTTTTLHLEREYVSILEDGVVHRRVKIVPLEYKLPGKVVEGYVQRTNFDPPLVVSTATTASDLASDGRIFFHLASDLVKIKHPREALVSTNLQYLFIPISAVAKVEKSSGPYDGYSAYGQPFFIPASQAALLSTKEPVAVCTPQTERQELDWVSYNPKVRQDELREICSPTAFGTPELREFLKKGEIFAVIYPAD